MKDITVASKITYSLVCVSIEVCVHGFGYKVVSVDHQNATATHLDGGIESVPSGGILLLSLLEATVVGLADLMYAAYRIGLQV